MDIVIATNRPVLIPGRMVRKGKTSEEMIGEVANKIFSKSTAWKILTSNPTWAADVVSSVTNHSLTVAVDPQASRCDSAIDAAVVCIDRHTLQQAKVRYDHDIWCGAFKSEEYFNLIVNSLPSADSDLVICDIASLNKLGGYDIEHPGLYVRQGNNLILASDYSMCKLVRLRVAILEAFSSLGVKKIKMEDVTDLTLNSNVSVSKELLAIAPKIGISLNRKTSFTIDAEFKGIVDLEKAKLSLLGLTGFPEIKLIGEHLIREPGNVSSVEKRVTLDLSFGLNVEMLTLFQGGFSGGYQREFHVVMRF
jgi:hypothetical protein